MKRYKFIAIEGNIGVGKTSLATMLSKEYDAHLILEEFVDNPFLSNFYQEPQRYAFPTELHFLLDRYEQLEKLVRLGQLKDKLNITDYIFTKSLLFAKMNLEEEEYNLFARTFRTIYQHLPQPELVVYIHSSTDRLIDNIHQRGRSFEQKIAIDYLKRVEQAYFDYFEQNTHLKVLFIKADKLDFVNNKAHYQQILDWIGMEYEVGITEVVL